MVHCANNYQESRRVRLRAGIRRQAFHEIAAFIAKEADRARDRRDLGLMHRLDRIHNYVVSRK